MKTEQIMERDLNGVVVRQSTKNAYFNANDLLALYHVGAKVERRIEDYLRTKNTKGYISAIQADIEKPEDSRELESPQVYYAKRGKNGGTWMHPYLFIDFAMWLSPKFKLTCVKWIYDKLIEVRIDSGDTFKEVNKALFNAKPSMPPYEYSNEAKMINKLAFGKSDGGQRNHATEGQLDMLCKLQKADIALIEKGLDRYDRFDALKNVKETLLLCQ